MAFAAKRLFQGQLTATLTTTLYTNPGGVSTIVKDIEIVNTDTVTRLVTLRMPGSTAGHEILNAAPIAPNELVQITCHIVLLTTETITGGADVASKVTVTISGAEG